MIPIIVALVWLAALLTVAASAFKASGALVAVAVAFGFVVWLSIGTVFLVFVSSPTGLGVCEGLGIARGLVQFVVCVLGLLPTVAYVLARR
jgi:hypothetical protein